MRNRIPAPGQEGRVLITPENGTPYYAKIEMADNPTDDGTPLTKETLLQDDTEAKIFGNAMDRTVDEAFMGIANKISLIMEDVATMVLTVTDASGFPLQGVYVNGITDENGNSIATDENGKINGYVSEGSITLSVNNYADIENYTEQINVVKGQSYTKTIQLNTRNFLKITSSRNIVFSGNVSTVDVSVGGGGGGGASQTTGYSAGGGGGYSTIQTGIPVTPNTNYQAIVGAGGSYTNPSNYQDKNGTSGGISSFLGVTANGGNGAIGYQPGSGNGNGGTRYDNGSGIGGDGSTYVYSSFTEQELYGGGGGGGSESPYDPGYSGGNPGGGKGGDYHNTALGQNGFNGLGGGGGGNGTGDGIAQQPGKGGSGVVAIRMHLKSAA